MFDIGFSELLLVGLVALLVLGPERLPTAARMAGLWIGRLKRGFTNIREEVEREIGADEIRRQLHNEDILAKERKVIGETIEQTKQSILDGSKAMEDTVASVKNATQLQSSLAQEHSQSVEQSKDESKH